MVVAQVAKRGNTESVTNSGASAPGKDDKDFLRSSWTFILSSINCLRASRATGRRTTSARALSQGADHAEPDHRRDAWRRAGDKQEEVIREEANGKAGRLDWRMARSKERSRPPPWEGMNAISGITPTNCVLPPEGRKNRMVVRLTCP